MARRFGKWAMILGWAGVAGTAMAQTPDWLHDSQTAKEKYVSPSGGGDRSGRDAGNSMAFSDAIRSAERDITYWVQPGTYRGDFHVTASGTKTAPVIFRSETLHQARLQGTMLLEGDYLWVWGFEVSAPNYQPEPDDVGRALNTRGAGIHLINNLIHDNQAMLGIGGWNHGADHVYYGNILYNNGYNAPFSIQVVNGRGWRCRYLNPHGMYVQHDYVSHGYKYLVGNLILDTNDTTYSNDPLPPEADELCDPAKMERARAARGKKCTACVGFHAYHTNNQTAGLFLQDNVFDNSGFLIGGEAGSNDANDTTQPAAFNVLRGNYFHGMNVILGYKKAGQFEFEDNLLLNAPLKAQKFWGAGERVYVNDRSQNPRCLDGGCYYKATPNVFRRNRFFTTDGASSSMFFATGAYTTPGDSRNLTAPASIDTRDTFDDNVYAPRANINWMEGLPGGKWVHGLDEWRQLTAGLGKTLGARSQVTALPTAPEVRVLPNHYNPEMAVLVVVNLGGASQVEAGTALRQVVSAGERVRLFPVRGLHQAPVRDAEFDGQRFSLALDGSEFQLFAVRTDGQGGTGTPPPPPPDAGGPVPDAGTPPPADGGVSEPTVDAGVDDGAHDCGVAVFVPQSGEGNVSISCSAHPGAGHRLGGWHSGWALLLATAFFRRRLRRGRRSEA